ALNVLSSKTNFTEESQLHLYKQVIHRLSEIADDVLLKGSRKEANSTPPQTGGKQKEIIKPHLKAKDLQEIILTTIEMKKYEWDGHDIKITSYLDEWVRIHADSSVL